MAQPENSSTLLFPRFPELPAELQIKVWTYVSSVPRVITIGYLPLYTCSRFDPVRDPVQVLVQTRMENADTFPRCFVENCPVPSVLHVSKTSRDVALKFYKPAFEGRLLHPTYFNFGSDGLRFNYPEALFQFCKSIPDIKKTYHVRSLIIAINVELHILPRGLCLFPMLESLVVQGEQGWRLLTLYGGPSRPGQVTGWDTLFGPLATRTQNPLTIEFLSGQEIENRYGNSIHL